MKQLIGSVLRNLGWVFFGYFVCYEGEHWTMFVGCGIAIAAGGALVAESKG